MLKRLILSALFAAVLAPAPSINAFSDWIGVYAVIDKVVVEPGTGAPERIQIWGDFALAKTSDRNTYEAPQRGYLYLKIVPGKEEVCRKEWADLKALAGTGQVIGFGARNNLVSNPETRPRVRKASDKPADPDPHMVGYGMVKMGDRPGNYEPIRELKALTRPTGSK